MTPEGKVKKAVRKLLDAAGAYYFLPATHGYGSSGTPDIVACLKGRFIGIECKAGDNQTTALQEKSLQRIRDTGGVALVINEHTLGELEKELKKWI